MFLSTVYVYVAALTGILNDRKASALTINLFGESTTVHYNIIYIYINKLSDRTCRHVYSMSVCVCVCV